MQPAGACWLCLRFFTVLLYSIIETKSADNKQRWMICEILMIEKGKELRKQGKDDKVKEMNKIKHECRKTKEEYYIEKRKKLEGLEAMHSPNIYKIIKEFKLMKSRINLRIQDKNGELLNDDQLNKRWEECIEEEFYYDDRTEKR